MNVCILALVIQHENSIFFASYCIVICVLSVCMYHIFQTIL
jgi:hypothetical protein